MKTTKAIDVYVSKVDIRGGVPRSAVGCPVVRALRRRLPPDTSIYLESTARVGGWIVNIPMRVVQWMAMFDDQMAVEPIRFRIYIPKEVLKCD